MIAGSTHQLGAWVKLAAAESIELLALAGFDFVVIDTEHASIDVRTVSTMIATARGCGIDPFVRVPGMAPRDVQVPLDAGARGLFVPQVEDASAARTAVRSTRFPPLGQRGASNTGRAGRWGLDELADYVAAGNDDTLLVVQVESMRGLESIADIGRVPGVDAIFVGPADLAVSSRRTLADPDVAALLETAERSCLTQGVPLGTTASRDAPDLLARGYDFLILGSDTGFLRSAGASLVSGARVPARGPARA